MLTRTRIATQVGFACFMSVAFAGTASSLEIVSGLGLDAGYACLDGATSCPGERDFEVDGIAPATGTIVMAGGPPTWTIDIDIDVASLTLLDSGGAVDGVDKIIFSNLTFDVSGWQGFDFLSTGIVSAPGAIVGTVTGNYEQFLGNTSVVSEAAFNEQVTFSAFTCSADGTGQCGFEVGFINNPLDFPSLIEPVGTTGGGDDHQFVMTFNVVVPEPSTASLLGLGLVGIASLRRRRA
jgi:hypothetical protein